MNYTYAAIYYFLRGTKLSYILSDDSLKLIVGHSTQCLKNRLPWLDRYADFRLPNYMKTLRK